MGPGIVGRATRPLVLLATVSAMTVGAIAPAVADSTPDPRPRNSAEVLRPVAPPAASNAVGAPRSVVDGDGIETARSSRPIAPGIRLSSYDRLESDKWLRVDSLSVDLDGSGAQADYLSTGKVSDRRTVSELAAGHDAGPGRRTVAAINADFFDINQTGAPEGVGIKDGTTVQSPAPGVNRAVGIGPDSAGRILNLYFEGTLTLPSGQQPLAAYNAANVPTGGSGRVHLGLGNRRPRTDRGQRNTGRRSGGTGRQGRVRVRHARHRAPSPTTPRSSSAARPEPTRSRRSSPATPCRWTYRARTDGGPVPRTAVGGRELLVVDGVAQNHDGEGNNTAAPRTAVGFSQDGRTMQVLTVDGRQADSGGVTLTELGLMMRRAGSYSALNLDGGGSSTLVARRPGSDALQVENSPSDGTERTVPNGLALTAPDGSGRLDGFWVDTRTPAGSAPGVDPVKGGHPERVFPGLTRRLTATGYDETYGPATGTPRWRTTRGAPERSTATASSPRAAAAPRTSAPNADAAHGSTTADRSRRARPDRTDHPAGRPRGRRSHRHLRHRRTRRARHQRPRRTARRAPSTTTTPSSTYATTARATSPSPHAPATAPGRSRRPSRASPPPSRSASASPSRPSPTSTTPDPGSSARPGRAAPSPPPPTATPAPVSSSATTSPSRPRRAPPTPRRPSRSPCPASPSRSSSGSRATAREPGRHCT